MGEGLKKRFPQAGSTSREMKEAKDLLIPMCKKIFSADLATTDIVYPGSTNRPKENPFVNDPSSITISAE